MYVCICNRVTDREIRRAVEQGASSLGELQRQLPVGRCCGRCIENAEALVAELRDGVSTLTDRVAAAA